VTTHHKRPGGRALELVLLFSLMGLTLALPVGLFLLMRWLGYVGYYAIPAGFALSVPLWRGFFQHYKYDLDSLQPSKGKDDPK
jgi:hypothetical protein